MITFPNAKINLGLSIGNTLPNGYHEIVTAMVPVKWCDILETVPADDADATRLITSGREMNCPPEKNLVMKAYNIFSEHLEISNQDIYLRKVIPDGAGLGGGSADAAFMLKLLNDIYGSPLSEAKLEELAAQIGSDCPMFIKNKPVMATGTGTTLSELDIDIRQLSNILIVKPLRSVSTKEAYAGVIPSFMSESQLREILASPISEWQGRLVNDFEATVFQALPECAEIKETLLASGALYASMSGSGSAVFGIFPSDIIADTQSFEEKGYITHRCSAIGV